jgi:TRAP-type C4-dicarboxylate transport system permease small subunit
MEPESITGPNRPKTRIPIRIEEALAGIILGVLALITFGNVVVRYLTNFSFAFTEEFSIFLMVIMTLLGSCSLMAKGGHLNVTYFVDKFPQRLKQASMMTAVVVTAFTFLLMSILGGWMAWDEYRFEVTSPGLGIPTWIYTVWLPLLCLAIFGRAFGVIIRMWKRKIQCLQR